MIKITGATALFITAILLNSAVYAENNKPIVDNINELSAFDWIALTPHPRDKELKYISIIPVWNEMLTKYYQCQDRALLPLDKEEKQPLCVTKTTCHALSTVIPSKDLSRKLTKYALKSEKLILSIEDPLCTLSKNSQEILCAQSDPYPKKRSVYAQWAIDNNEQLKMILETAKKHKGCAAMLIEFLEYRICITKCDNGKWIFMLGLYGEIHPAITIMNGYLVDTRMLEWFGEKGKCLPITRTMWGNSWSRTAQVTIFWNVKKNSFDCSPQTKLGVAYDLKKLPQCQPMYDTMPPGVLVFSEDAFK